MMGGWWWPNELLTDWTLLHSKFQDFVNSRVPIMLDYYDAKSPSSKLVATFSDCEFKVRGHIPKQLSTLNCLQGS